MTGSNADVLIRCIRRTCIEDPEDLYHYESHICFVCGAEFEPSPEMLTQVCESAIGTSVLPAEGANTL